MELHSFPCLKSETWAPGFEIGGVKFDAMPNTSLRPFSARHRREKNWIEEDFPDRARMGLLHILNEGIERDYLGGWAVAAKELGRIARLTPKDYSDSSSRGLQSARFDAESQLKQLEWDRLYDFCERLYNHLPEDRIRWYNNEEIVVSKVEAQAFFAEEMQLLFEEESLGYEFRDGLVQRRGKRHTIEQTSKAEKVLADQKLNAARTHFSKALRYFHDRKKTDHENTVKEAVCAVEAAAKTLFPEAKATTLGDFVSWATDNKRSLFPKTIGQTFNGLYGFRNSGEGVAHGAASGGVVTAELSEYILGIAASQIILLVDVARDDEEPPF